MPVDSEIISPIYFPSTLGQLRQGEILSNLVRVILRLDSIYTDTPTLKPDIHPFAILATQDCDLEQDFRARSCETGEDKKLPNLLFCEVHTAEELKNRNDLNSTLWKSVRQNKNERYHFFQGISPDQDALGEGLPELGVDFKRYFTLPTDEVYERLKHGEAKQRCRLVSPYLEHFSTRFGYYQFRVALPSDHSSE